MGCDQSREKDEQYEYSRTRTGEAGGAAPGGPRSTTTRQPTSTLPMPAGGRRTTTQGPSMAQSYTEKRIDEEDMFKNIINKTADSLINTTEVCDTIEGRDLSDRTREYTDLVLGQGRIEQATTLPVATRQLDVTAVLSRPIDASDKADMAGLCERVAQAMSSLAIADVGEIVTALPSL